MGSDGRRGLAFRAGVPGLAGVGGAEEGNKMGRRPVVHQLTVIKLGPEMVSKVSLEMGRF